MKTKKAINITHNHYWKCMDTPGYFLCKCGTVSRHNRETGLKEILIEEIEKGI